eukprot:CAMPEP_0119521648 /NCGR_PEP_ID=MMETSP1344-20130328/37280_1 /TAXON_ID=236787 /ORGANISM="Florenciella parvula, Strain CCMP2471" /LENGTH=82 /DNA_ID=CAMNT_0007559633 /DNA_START=68 /DNA_END=313 /DNA_ORIENTATION=+
MSLDSSAAAEDDDDDDDACHDDDDEYPSPLGRFLAGDSMFDAFGGSQSLCVGEGSERSQEACSWIRGAERAGSGAHGEGAGG